VPYNFTVAFENQDPMQRDFPFLDKGSNGHFKQAKIPVYVAKRIKFIGVFRQALHKGKTVDDSVGARELVPAFLVFVFSEWLFQVSEFDPVACY
jgi:hypothetical protein